jgi:uncharacterized protein (TIGR02301 family)
MIRLARAAKPEHISIMPRVLLAALAFFAVLYPDLASAQFWSPFWSPWSSRGYRPPSQERERRWETIKPFGQPRPKAQPKKPHEETKAAPPPERPVPYDRDLSRLAEVLGALHYLRPLCGEQDRERWRKEMQDLLDTEQPSQPRKDKLVASFNHGYQSYELTYRNCTPSANLAIDRSLDEGAKLARDIATKYGN